MAVYITGFTISTLLLMFSQIIKKTQKKYVVFLALVIPCMIAGFRANEIGTDTTVYLKQMTEAAIGAKSYSEYMSSRWFMIWRYLRVSDYELGFSFVVFVVAKLFRSIVAVQFAMQALVVFPYYCALKRINKGYPLWLSFLTYYLLIFNSTLNMMRQCIGMSFMLLTFAYAVNNEKKNAIIAEIVAIMFHTSALMGVVIYVMYNFVGSKPKKVRATLPKVIEENIRMIGLILGGLAVLIGINLIVVLLQAVGLSRYAGYITGSLTFMPNQLISRLPIIILFVLSWRKLKLYEPDYRFYFVMLVYDIICLQFTSVNEFGGRIAWYFSQFYMLTLPAFFTGTKKNKFILILTIAYAIFLWWFYYVNLGWGNTVPYKMI